MTSQRVNRVARMYSHKLNSLGYPGETMNISLKDPTREECLMHSHYMCNNITAIEDTEIEKKMRWLGFVQEVLAAFGIYSVNEMRWPHGPKKCAEEIKRRKEELEAEKKKIESKIYELTLWMQELAND